MWPCGNRLLKRLMSPSQKSQVMVAPHSHESVIFFRIFGIHSFFGYGHFIEYVTTSPAMNMWLADAADSGCVGVGGLDFAPMYAIRSVGQCDVNFPSLSPRGSRSKAVSYDYRRENQHECGI